MKRRYRYNHETGKVEEVVDQRPQNSIQVVADINPYEHTITGEMVTSRRRHKELLRQYNCIEVGNEREAFFKHGGRSEPFNPSIRDE